MRLYGQLGRLLFGLFFFGLLSNAAWASSGCSALSGYFDSLDFGFHGTSSASGFDAGDTITVSWSSGNQGSDYSITSGGATVFGPTSGTGSYTVPSATTGPIAIAVTNTGNFRIDWSCSPGNAPTAPTASAKSVTTPYNTAAAIDLSGSITGVDITAVTIGTAPTHGTVSVSGETVTYTPSSTFYGGTDTFTYTATNAGGTSAPAPVTVTVGSPTAPTASAKSAMTSYDTVVNIDLSGSITGVGITAVTIGTAPTHGTVSVSGKTVTYTPLSTFYGGTDTFTYTATNLAGTSAPATVTVTVGAPAAPTASAKSATTPYDTAAVIDLSGSITGVDIKAVTIGTAPTHGTVSVSGETVTYTPSSTFYGGTDTFTYTATNPGGTSAPATVTVTVGAPTAPTAAAKSVTTAYDTAAAIDLSGSITGVDITAVTIGTVPVHGTVSVSGKTVTYTPSSSFYGGTDTFTYTATNAGGTSAPATVTVTVGAPAAPTASAKSATTAYDTAAVIDLSGSITGVDITAVTIGTAPTHGTVSVSGKTVTYTPSSTFYGGTDTFTYTATNLGGTSAPATVTVTVGSPTAPTAAAKSATTAYDTPAAIDLSGSITGVGITAVTIGTAPTHGTVSVSGKTVTYTPSSSFFGGTDTFTYTASNPGGTSVPATVVVTVGAPTAPTVVAKAVNAPYNTAAAIDLSGSITGVDITAVTIGTAPTHGTVSVSGEKVTYTPSASFFGGPDTFTYTATNPGGTSAPATVTVTVLPRPPLAFMPADGALPDATAGDGYTQAITASNGTAPYSYAITAGALPAGMTLNPSTGTISGTGTVVTDASFSVTATDGLGFTGTAAYTLRVSPPAITAPSLDSAVVAGITTTVDLTSGATGGPFTGANLLSLSPPSAGTAEIVLGDTADADGAVVASMIASGRYKLRFTPSATFSGTATATYTLSNAYATSAPATVTFSVSPLPDPTRDADIAGLANAQTEATKRFAQMEIDNFNSHLEQLHGGGCLTNSWGINLSDNREGTQRQRAADAGYADKPAGLSPGGSSLQGDNGEADSASNGANDACSPFSSGSLAFWSAGSVNFGTTDFTDSKDDFDFTTVGISAGMDYRFNEKFVAGIGFGIGTDQSFIGDNGTKSKGLAYSAAVYGSYHPTAGVFIDGVAGYGWLDFDSRRHDAATGDLFDGSRGGQQVFGSVTAGYETTVGGFFVSPYLRISTSHSSLDAFSEDSDALSAIRYGEQDIDTVTGLIGLRLGYKIPTEWGSVMPKLRVEYGHDFADGSNLALSYANIAGSPSYSLTTAETARDYATIKFGTDIQVGTGWTFGADYGFSVDGHDGIGPQQFLLQLTGAF